MASDFLWKRRQGAFTGTPHACTLCTPPQPHASPERPLGHSVIRHTRGSHVLRRTQFHPHTQRAGQETLGSKAGRLLCCSCPRAWGPNWPPPWGETLKGRWGTLELSEGRGRAGAPGRTTRALANPRPAGASPAPLWGGSGSEGPEMEDWAAAVGPVEVEGRGEETITDRDICSFSRSKYRVD